MAQLPAVRDCTIGSSGGLISMTAMPKRPGQINKDADPDVLPIAQAGIAVFVGPMQRDGGFKMREGCAVIAAVHQRMTENAMAEQERAGPGLRLG
jgi:hypothetical protein